MWLPAKSKLSVTQLIKKNGSGTNWDIDTTNYSLYHTRNGRVLTWDPGAPGGPGGPCGPGGPVGRVIDEQLRPEKFTAPPSDLNRDIPSILTLPWVLPHW